MIAKKVYIYIYIYIYICKDRNLGCSHTLYVTDLMIAKEKCIYIYVYIYIYIYIYIYTEILDAIIHEYMHIHFRLCSVGTSTANE